MTRLRHVFRLEVVVESPFIFPGAETHAVGVDAPAMRDDDGRASLPADHLKGLLLEAVTALEASARLPCWAGGRRETCSAGLRPRKRSEQRGP